MKKGNLLWFATIFLSSILLMTNSCKKDEELSQEEIRLQKEQQIIELVKDQMPSVIVQYFNNHLEESRNQPNYDDYLDSLNTAINELYTTIEQSFSLDEFKSRFETVVAELDNQLKSTGTCVGLGYSKAAEVNVGGSGAIGIGIVAGLEAAGGGGLEYVYDFVNLDRQLYYYTVCSYGFSFGAGLAAGLSGSVGFTGIYSLLTGISYHGNTTGLNKFEGPSLGKSHTLSAGLQKVLGLDLSVTIGSSSAAYADFSGLLNLSPCPYTLTVLENSSKSYSFAVAGSLSYGPAVELLLAYSNNQVGSNSTGVVNTYHRFPGGRVIAGLKMAKELAIGEPMAGIITTLNPFDLSAAAVAITYAFKDFSNCPSSNSAIGTFPVENITSSSAQFGGVITNDNGSPVTVRGFVWSTNENPTISNNFGITNEGTGIGEFTSNITGLNPNTTYYVKAYATNGAGTAYGQQVEFKTLTGGGQPEGNIYFLSDESGNDNIYVGELTGNQIVNIQQVTNYSGNNRVFAYDVCKNTDRIAYVVTQDGHRGDIYIRETINSNPVLVPNQPSSRVGPLIKWAPDGNSLLFSIGNNQYYHHLQTATMNLDGSNYQIIINTNQPMGGACHKNTILWLDEGMYLGVTPQWAAHASDHELWFRNPAGTFTKLTNTSGIGERHVFMNPAASTIVFGTLDNSGRYGIRHMPKTGGTQSVIIPHSTNHICWPNGWLDESTIIYTNRPNSSGAKFDLYLIDLDGSNERNISNNPNANLRDAILR